MLELTYTSHSLAPFARDLGHDDPPFTWDEALLRASHIIPWKDCPDDAERLNVHNGLLLSALWDAAFDKGLVTFDDGGSPLFSPALSQRARNKLRWQAPIPLTQQHLKRRARHRERYFKKDPA